LEKVLFVPNLGITLFFQSGRQLILAVLWLLIKTRSEFVRIILQ
jgi:hypothetical protein